MSPVRVLMARVQESARGPARTLKTPRVEHVAPGVLQPKGSRRLPSGSIAPPAGVCEVGIALLKECSRVLEGELGYRAGGSQASRVRDVPGWL